MKDSMTLFDIDKAIAEFEFEIDEETGEILNYDALEQLHMDRNTKIENVGCLIKNLEAQSEALKAESSKMKQRAAAVDNRIKDLEGYLLHALQGEKFNSTRCAISWRKSSGVDVLEPDRVPDKYCTVETVTTRKPDKAAIKKAIEAGEEVDGCRLYRKNNVQIA